MISRIERLAYERRIERLKNENRNLKKTLDRVNKRLADCETNNEYLMSVLSGDAE